MSALSSAGTIGVLVLIVPDTRSHHPVGVGLPGTVRWSRGLAMVSSAGAVVRLASLIALVTILLGSRPQVGLWVQMGIVALLAVGAATLPRFTGAASAAASVIEA